MLFHKSIDIMCEEVVKTRRLMREIQVKKEPGVSWIEVKDKSTYDFLSGIELIRGAQRFTTSLFSSESV